MPPQKPGSSNVDEPPDLLRLSLDEKMYVKIEAIVVVKHGLPVSCHGRSQWHAGGPTNRASTSESLFIPQAGPPPPSPAPSPPLGSAAQDRAPAGRPQAGLWRRARRRRTPDRGPRLSCGRESEARSPGAAGCPDSSWPQGGGPRCPGLPGGPAGTAGCAHEGRGGRPRATFATWGRTDSPPPSPPLPPPLLSTPSLSIQGAGEMGGNTCAWRAGRAAGSCPGR